MICCTWETECAPDSNPPWQMVSLCVTSLCHNGALPISHTHKQFLSAERARKADSGRDTPKRNRQTNTNLRRHGLSFNKEQAQSWAPEAEERKRSSPGSTGRYWNGFKRIKTSWTLWARLSQVFPQAFYLIKLAQLNLGFPYLKAHLDVVGFYIPGN